MSVKVHSAQVVGLYGKIIDVEIDVMQGLHHFSVVGLPDKAVEESTDRLSAAIKNLGFISPQKKNQNSLTFPFWCANSTLCANFFRAESVELAHK